MVWYNREEITLEELKGLNLSENDYVLISHKQREDLGIGSLSGKKYSGDELVESVKNCNIPTDDVEIERFIMAYENDCVSHPERYINNPHTDFKIIAKLRVEKMGAKVN